jgi:hypothetical protein
MPRRRCNPLGAWGLRADLFVARRRRCPRIASSSRLDLGSQAPCARHTLILGQAPSFMKRSVEFTEAALKILSVAGSADRRLVLDGIKVHLIENDPLVVTRNKFPLRRPSTHAERELRLDNWRVFYIVMDNADPIIVNLIGEKRHHLSFIIYHLSMVNGHL